MIQHLASNGASYDRTATAACGGPQRGRVSAAAVQRDLAAALAGLPAGDRDVLLLIAWADLSYDEVAVALGIPLGTVRSRLHRARRKVREALGGADPTTTSEEPSA